VDASAVMPMIWGHHIVRPPVTNQLPYRTSAICSRQKVY
jgi:hypothetical protein